VTLVVVHRHDEIEVAADGPEEHGVGGERALRVDPGGLHGSNGRRDLRFFLAVPEQAVLSRVRVDRADRDPRRGDAGADQCIVSAPDGPFDQRRIDPGNRVDQADMRRAVNHPQVGCRQHHRDFGRGGQRCQQFRVPGIPVAGRMQGLLVQRRGADGVDVA